MFLNSFYDAVAGFSTDRNEVEFTNARGGHVTLTVHRIEDRLRRVDSPAAREAAYLASITDHPFKVAFPAASIFTHPFGLETPALREHRRVRCARNRAGARVDRRRDRGRLPLRSARLPALPVPRRRGLGGAVSLGGHRIDELLDRAIAADRAILDLIPAGVTTGLHVCRGNYRSSWLCSGSLEPVAERMFTELPYDVFLVEWEDVGRDGDYAPIRFVPDRATMVMGLVSSKVRDLEQEDELLRRLDEASRYLPLEQLALSSQCGFASVVEGNDIDEDAQWRKLELVARVADRLWGR